MVHTVLVPLKIVGLALCPSYSQLCAGVQCHPVRPQRQAPRPCRAKMRLPQAAWWPPGPPALPGDLPADPLWALGNRSATSRRKLQSAMLFAPPPQDLPRRRRLTAGGGVGSGGMFGRVGQWARGLWAHVGGVKQVQPLQPPPLSAGHHVSHDTHPRLLREFLGLADGEVTHPLIVSIHLPLLRNCVQSSELLAGARAMPGAMRLGKGVLMSFAGRPQVPHLVMTVHRPLSLACCPPAGAAPSAVGAPGAGLPAPELRHRGGGGRARPERLPGAPAGLPLPALQVGRLCCARALQLLQRAVHRHVRAGHQPGLLVA